MNNEIYLEYFNTIFIDDLLNNSCNEIFDIEYCNTCTHKLNAIFSENLSYDASMCTELAKYYIKITNLWHTIITTLNPVFNDDDIFLCEPQHVNNSNYKKYLSTFYKYFTNNPKPDNVQLFKDIKLTECSSKKNNLKLSLNDSGELLMKKYAEDLKCLINNLNSNKSKLINIVNSIFHIDDNKISINKELTFDKLNDLILETRNIIILLYSTYNKDYEILIKTYSILLGVCEIDNCVKNYA